MFGKKKSKKVSKEAPSKQKKRRDGCLGLLVILFCIWAYSLQTNPRTPPSSNSRATQLVNQPTSQPTVRFAGATRDVSVTPLPPTATLTPIPTRTPTVAATQRPSITPSQQPQVVAMAQSTVQPTQPSDVDGLDTGVVSNVIDGDTIVVEIAGQEYRVRYIGIDSPEVGNPCYEEAKEANERLVLGRTVMMERDVSNTDRFDRLLRYVMVGSIFVNEQLVTEGYAEARAYPPDTRYQEQLEEREQTARVMRLGCFANEVVNNPEPTNTPRPQVASEIYYATGNNINVRECPDTTCARVASVNRGDQVVVTGWEQGSTVSGSDVWRAVTINGQRGYIHSSLLSVTQPSIVVAPPPTNAPIQGFQNTTENVSTPVPNVGFTCNCSRTCGQMTTCEEARFQLTQCGCRERDADSDGIPCEDLCGG